MAVSNHRGMWMVNLGESLPRLWPPRSGERVGPDQQAYVDLSGRGSREKRDGRWRSWCAKRSAMLKQDW